MATIQIVLQAINDATRNINDVADSLEVLDGAQIQAAESARALSDAELSAAQAAADAIGAYAELRASVDANTQANVNAAISAEQLATVTQRSAESAVTAATAYARLSDEQLTAANAAIAAGAGFREEDLRLLDVMRDSILATGGIRLMTQAELAASAGATATSLSLRALSDAELSAANDALAVVAALTAEDAAFRAVAAESARSALEQKAFADATRALADAQAAAAARQAAAAAANTGFASGLSSLSSAISSSTAAVNNARVGWGLWGRVIHALQTQIPLWGGLLDGILPHLLTMVSGWHLLADAVVETVAVWVPAIITMGVAAAGAAPTLAIIADHMKDMYTVSTALGETIPPLSDGFKDLTAAVKPAVYQLFGDVLTIVSARTGTLTTAMKSLVPVVDQVGARIAIALNSSAAGSFLQTGVKDVGLLLNAFGDLFGILGNIIKVVPGYAQILLQLGTSFLAVAETVTRVAEPVLGLGMALHGFVIYVGLAVTAAVKFGGVIIGWGASLVSGVQDFIALARVIAGYVEAVGVATAAGEAFAAVDPFVWVGLAVGALVGLVVWLNSSKDATQQWGDAMQKAEVNATSLSAGIALVNTGVTTATAKAAVASAAQSRLAATTNTVAEGQGRAGSILEGVNSALSQQATKTSELTQVQQQQSADQQTYNTRVADLAKTYGSTTTAMGLLSAAGITMAQMLDTSGAAWAQIKQEVAATSAAYSAMGLRTGVLGNAMQVLDKQTTNQYAAIQKLNQGWDTQITAMTGAMSSFDSVAQGYGTLSSSTAVFTEKLGLLTVKNIPEAKAAIDSLSSSGIALNQAFTQQVGGINTMADSWRSAGLAQNMFKSGLAASIAPLEKYAAGSTEATAQLVGLAEEAGYQGPVSLAALNQYLGITSGMLKNTGGDMKTMQAAAAQATIQEALLTSAMQAQGSYIAGQLIGDINNAILKYHGVAAAATAYGNAVAQYGKQSQQAQTAQKTLTDGLIAAGKAAGDSTTQIAALIAKVLGIPAKVALQIVMTGTGLFTITGAAVAASQGAGGSGNAAGGLAAGGLIRVGSGPTADDVPALLSRGEVVVPTRLVNAGAVDHLRGRLPGFAGGGLVLAGNRQVLTGDYAVNAWSSFKAAGITAMETRMLNAARGFRRYADGGAVTSAAPTEVGPSDPAGGLVLQPAILQGFSGGLEQLHSPLILLVQAVRQQTTATNALATASKASTTAVVASTTAAAKPKPATPPASASATEAKKIAADKANAATLAARISAVETAIKDTPAKDKAARATEETLLKTLQSALAKQNKGTTSDEAALRKDIIAENKATAAQMTKAIAAITKLLASGNSSTSPSGLWASLTADEKALAAANAAIRAQTSGASGGSTASAAKATATSAASSAASLTSIKAQVSAAYTKLDQLYAADKAAAVGSAARAKDYAAIQAQYKTIDALLAAEKKAGGTTASSGSTASSGTGSSYTGYVIDRKAEASLASILAELKTENGLLRQACADLAKIKAEADPAAQAKAIGPAVASAMNSVARTSATSKTTRRG